MSLQTTIEAAWEQRAQLDASHTETRNAVLQAIELLDSGKARVAEPTATGWQVNDWLKKRCCCSFVCTTTRRSKWVN